MEAVHIEEKARAAKESTITRLKNSRVVKAVAVAGGAGTCVAAFLLPILFVIKICGRSS